MASLAETFVTKSYDKKERKVNRQKPKSGGPKPRSKSYKPFAASKPKPAKKGSLREKMAAEGPKRSTPKKKPTVGSRFAGAATAAKPKPRVNKISGTVAAAKKKGKELGPAAPGVRERLVQPYALPDKKRKKHRPLPGFTYGRDTM